MRTIQILMMLLVFTGCASTPDGFVSSDHDNEKWGKASRVTLYDEDGVKFFSDIVGIKTTFTDGYRTDREQWKLSIVNETYETACIRYDISLQNFKLLSLKKNPILVPPHTLLTIGLLAQVSTGSSILDFDYYDQSTAVLNVSVCSD